MTTLGESMQLSHRIEKLERFSTRYGELLNQAQRRRLIAGLAFFGGILLSQIYRGYSLEWVALALGFPVFYFYILQSRRLSHFQQSLLQLKAFYQKQEDFRHGLFTEAALPEEMINPDLARDLDLGVFFTSIDCCFSKQGKSRLNSWLCQEFSDSSLESRKSKMAELLASPGLLRRLQTKSVTKPTDFSRIGHEVERSFFAKPIPWKWIVPNAWIGLVICLLFPFPALIWKFILLVYVASVLAYLNHTQHLFSRLQDLHTDFDGLKETIEIYERLAKRLTFAPHLRQGNASRDVKKLGRFISLVSLRTNPILFYILNLMLPWDFIIAEFSEMARKKFVNNFTGWSNEVIEIEALGSLINLKLYQKTVWPEQVAQGSFVDVQGLSHPLLDQQKVVTNDFSADDKKVLIVTGSNMSGKSTFLRALGINLCLANIGAPVFARAMRYKPMKIVTCIRVSDSLRDGQSYFYAEVQRMKKILNVAQKQPVFFLIDEPLRGTNNKERLIGNQSYLLQILESQGQGLLCTHDLELTQLASTAPEIENYHFSDIWKDKALYFDYKIKEGPSKSTNALKILEKEGLYQAPQA